MDKVSAIARNLFRLFSDYPAIAVAGTLPVLHTPSCQHKGKGGVCARREWAAVEAMGYINGPVECTAAERHLTVARGIGAHRPNEGNGVLLGSESVGIRALLPV